MDSLHKMSQNLATHHLLLTSKIRVTNCATKFSEFGDLCIFALPKYKVVYK